MKKALVTGVTGQTGSYLAEYLLRLNYEVDGLVRRSSRRDHTNIRDILEHPNFNVIGGEIEDANLINSIVSMNDYDEVYNLAANSFVRNSFGNPASVASINYIGAINVVEAINNHSPATRLYHASTSEMYGGLQEEAYNENSYFHPRSPYGVAKLGAYWHVRNAREGYGLYACNGILFNHESPRRGPEFVTQKVAIAAKNYAHKRSSFGYAHGFKLEMGNLDARRDFGDARDYVRAMYLMLQQDFPEDYVVATGITHSVRHMIELLFGMGGTNIAWRGEGINEVGYDDDDLPIIVINPVHYRPTEVNVLLGDATKARQQLGWEPEISFYQTLCDMYEAVEPQLVTK